MAEYIEREAFLEKKRKLYCENCKRRYGLKKGKSVVCYEIGDAPCRSCGIGDVLDDVEDFPAADVRPVPEGGIGEMSDGYHTFNGLYYQRMVLFAALVKVYKGMAWKSWRHEDGELCFGKDNYFIVGIDTPQGSYTYHYHGQHWNLFDCEELPVAKHWDGHTEKDVTRLLSLDVRPVVRASWEEKEKDGVWWYACSVCGEHIPKGRWGQEWHSNYCPSCGADMRGTNDEKA